MRLPHAAWLLSWLSLAVGTASAADLAGAASDIGVNGGRLSVRAEGMVLSDLLATLEQRGIASVRVHGDASRIVVSDSFEVPDAAHLLRRVLSAQSHILIDRGAPAGGPRLIDVILLGSVANTGTRTLQMPDRHESADPHAATTGDELQPELSAEILVHEALSSDSNTERSRAAEALAYRSPAEATAAGYVEQVLAQQLVDTDENVRERAIEILKDTADEVPIDTLAQLAREDVSAPRRIQALELLAERAEQDARAPLQIALTDAEPAVRERARELIEDWHLDP